MDDTISRAAAIDIVNRYNQSHMILKGKPIVGAASMVIEMEGLPSAERPAGEWIKDEFGITVCSECKRPRRDSRVDHINFCNSCGARMINTK